MTKAEFGRDITENAGFYGVSWCRCGVVPSAWPNWRGAWRAELLERIPTSGAIMFVTVPGLRDHRLYQVEISGRVIRGVAPRPQHARRALAISVTYHPVR